MPRRARSKVLDDGCYAHVYSRALEKRHIFREGEDFQLFKRLLSETKLKYNYHIHHYCLMNTHFHLAVSIRQVAAFSAALREIKQDYVRWYNEKYEHRGPVWWGRFGSRLIQDESYLFACGTYIELNPVEAGLVAAPEEWKYR
jgi:putative transposase